MVISREPTSFSNQKFVLSETVFWHELIKFAGPNKLFEKGLEGRQFGNPGGYGLVNARGMGEVKFASYRPMVTNVLSEKQFRRIHFD